MTEQAEHLILSLAAEVRAARDASRELDARMDAAAVACAAAEEEYDRASDASTAGRQALSAAERKLLNATGAAV